EDARGISWIHRPGGGTIRQHRERTKGTQEKGRVWERMECRGHLKDLPSFKRGTRRIVGVHGRAIALRCVKYNIVRDKRQKTASGAALRVEGDAVSAERDEATERRT